MEDHSQVHSDFCLFCVKKFPTPSQKNQHQKRVGCNKKKKLVKVSMDEPLSIKVDVLVKALTDQNVEDICFALHDSDCDVQEAAELLLQKADTVKMPSPAFKSPKKENAFNLSSQIELPCLNSAMNFNNANSAMKTPR